MLRPDLLHIASLVEPGSKLLELGCGKGELLSHLVTHKDVDGRGIELERENVSTCVVEGLMVIQGNAEMDLKFYPDKCFDYVICSQVLQAMHQPKDILIDMLRIAKHVIISIPNFGHWKNRLYLSLHGRMPVTSSLSYQWYDTPNIHFCTTKDFDVLAGEVNARIEHRLPLNENGKALNWLLRGPLENLCASKEIYLLTSKD
jgi:methionine biosynthesis protein MetW